MPTPWAMPRFRRGSGSARPRWPRLSHKKPLLCWRKPSVRQQGPPMPKDNKKYRYYNVALRLDSWTQTQLEQDAELHQMEDLPAKLIAIRLTDYYKLVE